MSNIDNMIYNHPFPKNGAVLNRKYITIYKNTEDEALKNKCIDNLIKINMRILAIMKTKYAKSLDYGELLSIFYDVMRASTRTFDFEYDKNENSFLNYVIRRFRASLATYRWKTNSIVRYPMNQKTRADTVDVDLYSDTLPDISDKDPDAKIEFDNIIENYSNQNLTSKQWEALQYLLLSADYSNKEISEMPIGSGHTRVYIGQKINLAMRDIRRYMRKQREEENAQ